MTRSGIFIRDFLQAVFERKKNDTCPFQPLAHSIKEIDFLNNYHNNLKNVL